MKNYPGWIQINKVIVFDEFDFLALSQIHMTYMDAKIVFEIVFNSVDIDNNKFYVSCISDDETLKNHLKKAFREYGNKIIELVMSKVNGESSDESFNIVVPWKEFREYH